MDKRFIYFILLSVLILFGYNYFLGQTPEQKKISVPPSQTEVVPSETIKTGPQVMESKPVPAEANAVEIGNDKVALLLSSWGATVSQAIVRDFGKNLKESINLVDSNKYFLKNILNINGNTIDLNNFAWSLIKKSDSSAIFSARTENLELIKEFQIAEGYTGSISYRLTNSGTEPINIQKFGFSWGPTLAIDTQQYNQKQIAILNVRKVSRFKPKKKEEVTTLPIARGWMGVRDQFFSAIFYGQDLKLANVIHRPDQSLGMEGFFQEHTLAPKQSLNVTAQFFMGPQNYDLLRKNDYNLDKIIDFGIFRFLAVPMLFLLNFFYNLTLNYGFAIILLTIVIRALLWWPTQKSYSSMKKMQTAMNKMQPRLKTLKELYKDNPSRLNEETMKLYREYQINPMGGCLPMLLQMPIFFALYSTLTAAVELKGANFIWIWTDLSKSDPLYILPIAMGLSMFIQQKMSTPPAATPEAAVQQKMMLYLMPAMLTFFSFMWPSGLLLYWVISNIVSIGQQVIINRTTK